jgi:hypothetical protein
MAEWTSEDVRVYAKWLTQACLAAGLDAAQYGAEILVQGTSNHLSERIVCHADERGDLRWFWSWGRPIADLRDPARILGPDEIDDLVAAIRNVVAIEVKPR